MESDWQHSTLRRVTTVMGAGFALQGIGWLVVPQWAAAALGMPLLTDLGRSTQVGDFAAFFLTLGVSILVGVRPGNGRWLYFPAGMLASAAVCRTLTWAVHGAAFAALFITVEVAGSLLLLASARRVDSR